MNGDEAALSDLLSVTRRVMLPVAARGTFWCEQVDTNKMIGWVLSVGHVLSRLSQL